MKPFEQIYELTERIGSQVLFSRAESRLYYDMLCTLPHYANVLEIGCKYGRSTSILAQVAKEKEFSIDLVDNYREDDSRQAIMDCMAMLVDVGVSFTLHRKRSDEMPFIKNFHLVLIDGGHDYKIVRGDLWMFEPMLKYGTKIVCHDYRRDSLPDVTRAIDEFLVACPYYVKYRQAETLVVLRRER